MMGKKFSTDNDFLLKLASIFYGSNSQIISTSSLPQLFPSSLQSVKILTITQLMIHQENATQFMIV
jgi:hypothetical protein